MQSLLFNSIANANTHRNQFHKNKREKKQNSHTAIFISNHFRSILNVIQLFVVQERWPQQQQQQQKLCDRVSNHITCIIYSRIGRTPIHIFFSYSFVSSSILYTEIAEKKKTSKIRNECMKPRRQTTNKKHKKH